MGAVVACSTAAGVDVGSLGNRRMGFYNLNGHGCCIECDTSGVQYVGVFARRSGRLWLFEFD